MTLGTPLGDGLLKGNLSSTRPSKPGLFGLHWTIVGQNMTDIVMESLRQHKIRTPTTLGKEHTSGPAGGISRDVRGSECELRMCRAEMRTDELLSKLRCAECHQTEFERRYLHERRCA